MNKTIRCVYSYNKLDFKKYAKAAEYDEVISYYDIITKLVKNDIDSNKPSTFIINSYKCMSVPMDSYTIRITS